MFIFGSKGAFWCAQARPVSLAISEGLGYVSLNVRTFTGQQKVWWAVGFWTARECRVDEEISWNFMFLFYFFCFCFFLQRRFCCPFGSKSKIPVDLEVGVRATHGVKNTGRWAFCVWVPGMTRTETPWEKKWESTWMVLLVGNVVDYTILIFFCVLELRLKVFPELILSYKTCFVEQLFGQNKLLGWFLATVLEFVGHTSKRDAKLILALRGSARFGMKLAETSESVGPVQRLPWN